MTDEKTITEQLGSTVLAVLTVLSVFAMSVFFTGLTASNIRGSTPTGSAGNIQTVQESTEEKPITLNLHSGATSPRTEVQL